MENLIGYAKSDLLTPLLLNEEFNLDRSNDAARAWCQKVNAVEHSQIATVPEQRLAKERPLRAGEGPVGQRGAGQQVQRVPEDHFLRCRPDQEFSVDGERTVHRALVAPPERAD